jgi:RhtB (resistance to homoserine/threonine) family protein
MGDHLPVFLGVAAILVLFPGPDTAVVTKNVLIHGRRVGIATSLGVVAGVSVWTLAAALGIASLLHASLVAFTVLKLAGAVYLIWLGVQAIRAANHLSDAGQDATIRNGPRPAMSVRTGFRQGLFSDLGNPKAGIFFTSLLPQFVDPGRPVFVPFLVLGIVFAAMTILWLFIYCLITARAAQTMMRPRVRAILDRVTGVLLIAIGLKVATEHR